MENIEQCLQLMKSLRLDVHDIIATGAPSSLHTLSRDTCTPAYTQCTASLVTDCFNLLDRLWLSFS